MDRKKFASIVKSIATPEDFIKNQQLLDRIDEDDHAKYLKLLELEIEMFPAFEYLRKSNALSTKPE